MQPEVQKPLRNNSTKLKIRAPFMPVATDVSIYSNTNTTFDYNMSDESKLRESFLSCISDENEIKEAPMEACDIREKGNPQYVSDYAATIFKYLRENEVIRPFYYDIYLSLDIEIYWQIWIYDQTK